MGRDANDQYFPLAFGVVENETKERWRWFIKLLMEDIGQERRYVFIYDQQKIWIFLTVINVVFKLLLLLTMDAYFELYFLLFLF